MQFYVNYTNFIYTLTSYFVNQFIFGLNTTIGIYMLRLNSLNEFVPIQNITYSCISMNQLRVRSFNINTFKTNIIYFINI